MNRSLAFLLLVMLVAAQAAAGVDGGKSLLIHAKTSPKSDVARFLAVSNVAIVALHRGYKVTVLFDAGAVTAIGLGTWYGGDTTPLDRAKLPERERLSLSNQLGLPLASIPDNYGDYMRFLKGRGAELYANRSMMLHYRIGDDEYDKAVTPVGMEKMIDIFANADVYVAY